MYCMQKRYSSVGKILHKRKMNRCVWKGRGGSCDSAHRDLGKLPQGAGLYGMKQCPAGREQRQYAASRRRSVY